MDLILRYEGADTVELELRGMIDRVLDFTPVWPEVKAEVQHRNDMWLSSEGEGSFPPLKDSTLKKKPRRSNRPLDKSGAMWDSLIHDTPLTVFVSEPTRCEIGTSADWAHWHMEKRKHMPARPPIKMTQLLKDNVTTILRDYVRRRK